MNIEFTPNKVPFSYSYRPKIEEPSHTYLHPNIFAELEHSDVAERVSYFFEVVTRMYGTFKKVPEVPKPTGAVRAIWDDNALHSTSRL